MDKKQFEQINIDDDFFDSLKSDYPEFADWFIKKSQEHAYVQYDESGKLIGFLYLKMEYGTVGDIIPIISSPKILKVGTFKIDAHGTRLGERFIKVITDTAMKEKADICYITIFAIHVGLINLIKKFGFIEYGIKNSSAGQEKVFVKNMLKCLGDINLDYPLINTDNAKKYILGIYPQYHSIMFPDSILTTEKPSLIKDISYGNSIHKIYICRMNGIDNLKQGDILVIYRTADDNKSAEYSSVVTSIGVVENVKRQDEFTDFNNFYNYSSQYSVFDKTDLEYWYNRGYCRAIKFTYNIALNKRITRHDLIEEIGLDRDTYWGFFELSDAEFSKIIRRSNVDSDYFIY